MFETLDMLWLVMNNHPPTVSSGFCSVIFSQIWSHVQWLWWRQMIVLTQGDLGHIAISQLDIDNMFQTPRMLWLWLVLYNHPHIISSSFYRRRFRQILTYSELLRWCQITVVAQGNLKHVGSI